MFKWLKDAILGLLTRREFERKGFLQGRRRKDSIIGMFAERSRVTAVAMLVLVWMTSVVVLVMPSGQPLNMKLIERQIAPTTIYAHMDFSFEDPMLTAEARETARAQVPLYYKIDGAGAERALNDLRNILAETRKRGAAERRAAEYIPDAKAPEAVARLDRDAFTCLLQITESQNQERSLLDSFERILGEGVIGKADKEKLSSIRQIRISDPQARIREPKALKDIPSPKEAAAALVDSLLEYYSHPRKPLIKDTLTELLASLASGGDIVFDKDATDQKLKEASDSVRPIMVELRKGQPIIVKDQEISRRDLTALRAYNNELELRGSDQKIWSKISENAMLALALMALTGVYLYHIHPEVVRNNRVIWLLGTVTMLAMLANYAFMELFMRIGSLESIPPPLLFIAVPLGFATTLLSSLYGLRAALYVGLYVSIIAALSVESSLSLAITGMMVSGIAGFAVRRSTNYKTYFTRSFLSVSFTTLAIALIFIWKEGMLRGASFELWRNVEVLRLLEWALLLSFITGLLTAIMSEISIFFFEYVFDVSTDMSLLLLCDLNHPLLKRLQFEAPGTYHHSLLVSTLAEQAAQEIGANSIRARVCALFHDIGKLSQPEYFTENSADEDKHKELNPRMSSLIILNHVKEGVELARRYKLKKIIRDAIEQHHGTDLVYYFYKRAMEGSDEPIGEQEFKYSGPLPREKEVAIVMLADCCEAASRALQKPSHQKIDALVSEIFRKKIRDEQLDSAELSFRELAKVRKSFVKTLTTMMHGRISYPKDDEDDDEDDLFVASERAASQTQIFTVEDSDAKGG